MTGQLVGIKKVNFTDGNGNTIKGNQLMIIVEIPENRGDGYEFLFAPQKKHSGFFTDEQIDNLGLTIGSELNFSFTRFGSIDKDTIQVSG